MGKRWKAAENDKANIDAFWAETFWSMNRKMNFSLLWNISKTILLFSIQHYNNYPRLF